MKLAELKVSTRLAVGYGLLVLLSLVSSGMALDKLASIEANLEDVVTDNNVKIQLNNDMAKAVHVVGRVIRTVVILQDKAEIDHEVVKITQARESYDKNWETLQKYPASETGRSNRAQIKEARDLAVPLNNKVLEFGKSSKTAEAAATLIKEAGPATTKWLEAIERNIAFQEQQNTKQFEESVANYKNARIQLIVFGLLSAVLACVMAWLVTRSIVRQLGAEPSEAAAFAQYVAAGDLTRECNLRRDDQTSLMAQMKAMQTSLAQVVENVRSNAEGVASASSQIAQGNTDLSSRTEEQASALEETAASMEQLSSTVKQNADNARQGNQLAQSASTVAVKGGEVVGQVVQTMKGINDASKKISDIIGVIDGIAFQTNILALNAAVEAARAGEHGRGFAVVASEVRSLAGRSADAAKEIKKLISASVERVEQGTVLVDQAGATMNEVVSSIQRVTDLMGEISAASAEQSAGVAQVGEAVIQMDQATQQNAALVEESAAAAESLRSQAQQLVQAVAVFKTAEHVGMARAIAGPQRQALEAEAAPFPERRGPGRPQNVKRLPIRVTRGASETSATPPKKTGTDDGWASF
jgi:methyl-accepting chemotaxis protein